MAEGNIGLYEIGGLLLGDFIYSSYHNPETLSFSTHPQYGNLKYLP